MYTQTLRLSKFEYTLGHSLSPKEASPISVPKIFLYESQEVVNVSMSMKTVLEILEKLENPTGTELDVVRIGSSEINRNEKERGQMPIKCKRTYFSELQGSLGSVM